MLSSFVVAVSNLPDAHAAGLAVDSSGWCPQSSPCYLTTGGANEVIVVYADAWDASNVTLSSIHDTAGLSFHHRASASNFTDQVYLDTEEWWAVSAGPLLNDNMTFTWSIPPTWNDQVVFGIAGANTSQPFDPSPLLPAAADKGYAAITTENANDMVISVANNFNGENCPCANATDGYTSIYDSQNISTEYQVQSSAVSSLQVTFNIMPDLVPGSIADALQGIGPPISSTTHSTTSSSSFFTCRTWPDVSPFCHSLCLLRL